MKWLNEQGNRKCGFLYRRALDNKTVIEACVRIYVVAVKCFVLNTLEAWYCFIRRYYLLFYIYLDTTREVTQRGVKNRKLVRFLITNSRSILILWGGGVGGVDNRNWIKFLFYYITVSFWYCHFRVVCYDCYRIMTIRVVGYVSRIQFSTMAMMGNIMWLDSCCFICFYL